jgi:MFS family permease
MKRSDGSRRKIEAPKAPIFWRKIDPQLPRDVWLLQVGGVLNSFGNGVVFPFLAIYFRDVRGLGIEVAGLAIAVSSVMQLLAVLALGPLIDRAGARTTLGAGLVLQAAGFGLLPLVSEAWHAYALMALEGVGSAAFWPSQSTLISRLTPPARRHAAFAQQRVTMNLGVGLGGLVGGLIANVDSPTSFTVLFVLDAVTFLAYVVVLFAIRVPATTPEEAAAPAGSYLDVLRHRVFLGLWTLNFLFVAVGYSLFNLLPPFVREHSHVSERQIGAIFFVNTLVIVLAQLPISRAIEGRRRMRALALMPLLWAAAWLLVDASGYWLDGVTAFLAVAFAAAVLGVGECFHGPAHQALVADLATDRLRGRYFSVHSASWGLGGAVGPAVGGLLLAAEPFALWPLAAAVCVVAAVGAAALERGVPPRLRRIPRAQPQHDLVPGELEPAPMGIGPSG